MVCRKLHNEWGRIACEEAGLLQNNARAEDGDYAQEVCAGSNPPLATEYSTCKQSDNREFCTARDERRGHNGHATIVLVFNGSGGHDAGHAAASTDKNRHKRLAGKAKAAEHAVEDKRDTSHVTARLKEGKQQEQYQHLGNEAEHRANASDNAIENQSLQPVGASDRIQTLLNKNRNTGNPHAVFRGIGLGAFNLFCVRIGVYLLGFAVFVNIGCDDACVSGFVSKVFRFGIKTFLDRCCLKCGNSILVALIGSQNIKSFLVGIYIYFNRFVFARFVVIRLIGRRQTSGFSIFDECLGSRIKILFFGCGFKGVNAFLRTLEFLRYLIELLLTRTEIPAITEYAIVCPVGGNAANGGNGNVVHKEHNHNEDRQCQNAVGNHTVDLVGRGQLACHILATAVVDDR